MRQQLSDYSTRIDAVDSKRQKLRDIYDIKNQLQAIVNTISTLKVVVNKLNNELSNMDNEQRTLTKS